MACNLRGKYIVYRQQRRQISLKHSALLPRSFSPTKMSSARAILDGYWIAPLTPLYTLRSLQEGLDAEKIGDSFKYLCPDENCRH